MVVFCMEIPSWLLEKIPLVQGFLACVEGRMAMAKWTCVGRFHYTLMSANDCIPTVCNHFVPRVYPFKQSSHPVTYLEANVWIWE